MKYIKTPVVYEKEDMTIWGRDGQWIATLALGWLAPELVTAINEHDKLTGLHDELVKQRDALVDACEALLAWNKPCESLFQPDTAKYVPITLPEVIELAEAALARVAGGWG